MNNKEFLSELSERLGYSLKDTAELEKTLTDELTNQLVASTMIMVPNFGSFEVKQKMERIIVNPATKERMLVPPKLVVGFKPATSAKTKFK